MEINVQMNELEDKNTNQNFSSSSDEPIDTSDELLDVDANADVDFNERFIADCAAEAQRNRRKADEETEVTRNKAARQKAGEMIKQIEASRVQTYHTPGNHLSPLSQAPVVLPLVGENNDMPQQMFNYNVSPPGAMTTSASTAIDNNYIVVGGHLDQAIQDKI